MSLFRKKASDNKVSTSKVEAANKVVKATPATRKASQGKEKTTTPAIKGNTSVFPSKEGEKGSEKSLYSYRITEKATRLADKNVYVFNIAKTINKISLKKDLETKYKVKVLSVNIVNSPKKDKFYRGKWGTRGGGKKAYITLKAGDSIVL